MVSLHYDINFKPTAVSTCNCFSSWVLALNTCNFNAFITDVNSIIMFWETLITKKNNNKSLLRPQDSEPDNVHDSFLFSFFVFLWQANQTISRSVSKSFPTLTFFRNPSPNGEFVTEPQPFGSRFYFDTNVEMGMVLLKLID